MRCFRLHLLSAAVLTVLSAAGLRTAAAATITDYNRATFQTALSGATLSGQDFDLLPLGAVTTVSGVTYTPSMGTGLVTNTYLTTTNPNGLGSTSIGYFQTSEALTISFSAPITAFALDINTFALNSGAYRAVVNDGSGSVVASVFDTFPGNLTGQFLGFTDSSPFSSLTISANPADAYSYTVDSLVYGNSSALTATPEPSTLLLLGTGLLGAAGAVRRRVFQR